jgi:hypothetical protein
MYIYSSHTEPSIYPRPRKITELVTLQNNPNHNATLSSSHTIALNGPTANPNKTLVTTSPNEKKKLLIVAMRRPLAFNGLSEESKHNLEIPDLNRI